MKIEKEFVLEYNLKFDMLKKSLPIIKKHLIKRKASHKKDKFVFNILSDSINVINDIIKKDDFNYSHAFILSLGLGFDYSQITGHIKEGKMSLDNLRNEEYWDIGEIDLEEGIFFSYTFLNEVYGQLNIDFNELNKSTNLEKDYILLRNKILKNNQ